MVAPRPQELHLKMARTIGAGGKVSGSKSWPENEKYVCLQVMSNCVESLMEWYILDVLNEPKTRKKVQERRNSSSSSNGCSKCVQKISPYAKGKFGPGTFFASMGSIVFCIGGFISEGKLSANFEFSKDVYMFDKCRPDKGFQKLPPMMKGRANGAAVALGQKLYVFGGNDPIHDLDQDPWAEYYDLGLHEENEIGDNSPGWQPLRQRPILMDVSSKVYAAAYGDKKNIIVGAITRDRGNFIYNIESDSWEPYKGGFIPLPNGSHMPIMVEDTLYYLSGGHLYAHDLTLHESYMGPVKGSVLQEIGMECIDASLVHLGGSEFCFFTIDPQPYFDPSTGYPLLTILCIRIQAVKGNNGYLHASVLSTQSFHSDHWLELLGATLLFKKSNGRGSKVTDVMVKSESRAVQIAPPAEPSLLGASNTPVSEASAKPTDLYGQTSDRTLPGAPSSQSASGTLDSKAPANRVKASVKPINLYGQRSDRTLPGAPSSQSASGTLHSTAPVNPVKGDISRGVSIQFGTVNPDWVALYTGISTGT